MKRAEWQHLFDSLPPGLELKRIAKQFRKGYRLTATWARRCNYQAASGHQLLWTAQRRREFSRVNWDSVPWEKRNVDIAKMYGVSREIVRRRRMERNEMVRA